MRGLFIVLLVLVAIASFSFVTYSNSSEKPAMESNNQFEFSTFTSAVCENKEELVHCKDELFVNCNGKISRANEIEECNGMNVEIPAITGYAVFDKDWKDPRG